MDALNFSVLLARKPVTTLFYVMEVMNIHEREVYKEYKLLSAPQISKKDYRKISAERKKVQAELKRILEPVQYLFHIGFARRFFAGLGTDDEWRKIDRKDDGEKILNRL